MRRAICWIVTCSEVWSNMVRKLECCGAMVFKNDQFLSLVVSYIVRLQNCRYGSLRAGELFVVGSLCARELFVGSLHARKYGQRQSGSQCCGALAFKYDQFLSSVLSHIVCLENCRYGQSKGIETVLGNTVLGPCYYLWLKTLRRSSISFRLKYVHKCR